MPIGKWKVPCDCEAPVIETGVVVALVKTDTNPEGDYEVIGYRVSVYHGLPMEQSYSAVCIDGKVSESMKDADQDDLMLVCSRCGAQGGPA